MCRATLGTGTAHTAHTQNGVATHILETHTHTNNRTPQQEAELAALASGAGPGPGSGLCSRVAAMRYKEALEELSTLRVS